MLKGVLRFAVTLHLNCAALRRKSNFVKANGIITIHAISLKQAQINQQTVHYQPYRF